MAASIKMGRWMAVIGVLLFTVYQPASSHSKDVVITLDAKWKNTPFLLEASEFLAKEKDEYFWGFVDAFAAKDSKVLSAASDKDVYDAAMETAGRFLSPMQVKMLAFSLGLAAHSPSVQMQTQLAEENNVLGCALFVDVNQQQTCDVFAMKAFIKAAEPGLEPVVYKSDHIYPGPEGSKVTVILYAQLGTKEFAEFHRTLKELALSGEIKYVFRHYVKTLGEKKKRLSGYGVELAIKSTEYKAKDDTKVQDDKKDSSKKENKVDEVDGFIFSKLKELHPDDTKNLEEFKQHLLESQMELAPLKVWQLQDLSFQAGQKVVSARPEDGLRVLRDISQDFPTEARSLIKTAVSQDFKKDVETNQKLFEQAYNLPAGDSALFLNGLQIDLEVYDIYNLLDTMRSESKLMEGMHALGITSDQVSGMLNLNLKEEEDTQYAVDIRDPAVQWINDIEKDRKYAGWPGGIQEFLRPTFPGMLRHIRKNVFHMVFMVNPADPKVRDVIKMAEAFYVHSAPVRIGLVFVVNQDKEATGFKDAGVALVNAFNFIKGDRGPAKGLSFITDVYERMKGEDVTPDVVIDEFYSQYKEEAASVFGEDSDYNDGRKAAVAFYERTGFGELPQVLMNGQPLKKEDLTTDTFEEAAVSTILRLTPEIQKAVYQGHLNDHMDTLDYIMDQPNVMPRLNARILDSTSKCLDYTKPAEGVLVDQPDEFSKLTSAQMTGAVTNNMRYLAKREEDGIRAVTNWVVADLETESGRQILYNAVKQMKHSNEVRLGVVYNPVAVPRAAESKEGFLISRAVHVAMKILPRAQAKSFVTKLLKEENVQALAAGTKTLADLAAGGMDMQLFMTVLGEQDGNILITHREFVQRVLGFKAGETGIVTNGKVIGPLSVGEDFNAEDFTLMEKFTLKAGGAKLKKKVEYLPLSNEGASDMIMKVAALMGSTPQPSSRKEISILAEKYSTLTIPAAQPDQPAYDVVAILDPTTRVAQKITPMLMILQEVANVNLRVSMNCKDKLSEMPQKTFYRYVLEPGLMFEQDGSLAEGPSAIFQNLPQKAILTLNMDAPESWLVEAVRSPYDLDNIFLKEVETGIEGQFELAHLLLEGHCFDANTGQPPRGLQFTLGTNSTPVQVDTIVMANLGYFQLKANPGAWVLKLRQGRSADIYDISSHEYTDSAPDSSDVVVLIDSLKSKIVKLKVSKKRGMEREDLLGGSDGGGDGGGGIWDSIQSSFAGKKEEEKDQTLNIFSLASGHLYERFTRIMMLSVVKNTKSKVKFWFLKNYMSPSFKDFIPHMAKEYGFEFELVQYKWPRWLHQQTEKQRIIWGYKILFLDVLFPLDVKKIIFVDADQVVRADLQELYDFDLGGAPYAYTPFCSSRKEMDGFRFWRSGYWANHLAGRSYHISALYVVDLVKFRKIAAGDRLRGQYQGLSQDPNSLSNLDQDLPNNMIHQVPIKSLPQEWLWCETWCSDSEKPYAKTIDLCNNPRTKEPKLDAAQRIVVEWKDYDNEARKLWDKVNNLRKEKDTVTKTTKETDSKRDEL